MNILFRENASKNEKIFTIFSLLWMVLAIYGMWINFDSNIGLNTAVIISSILWGIAMVYPLSIDNHPSNKLAHASALKKVSTILLLTLAASGFSWCILALSIPAIYTENFGKPTSEIVQVKRKYSVTSRSIGQPKPALLRSYIAGSVRCALRAPLCRLAWR
jgi:hypothetical protein